MRLVLNRIAVSALVGALVLGAAPAALGGVLIEARDAPEWQVSEWINDDPGPLSRQRGAVVVLLFFQLWCPESNDFAIPLFERWDELWAERAGARLIGIHSVFEEHDQQTPERLREFVADRGIDYPVGIDAYRPGDDIPITLRRFEALGTPQVVILDREGQIRFSHFGRFDPDVVEAWAERLMDEKPEGDDRRSRRGRRR